MEGKGHAQTHVAVYASLCLGHMIPLAELAKILLLRHGFSVTFISIADPITLSTRAHDAFLQSLPAGVNSVTLPAVAGLPDDLHHVTRIYLATAASLPALRDVIHDLKQRTRLVAFVVDLFGTECIDLAKEAGVPPFMFFTSNLLLLSLAVHLPRLCDSKKDIPALWELPGCIPLHLWELPDQLQEAKGEALEAQVQTLRHFTKAQGILVNTFQELEPGAAEVFKKEEFGLPPVYLVGPLVHDGWSSSLGVSDGCLKWLDNQPVRSVLLVSLGSMGSLSHEQMKEMALGLELSGQRFLWVVRCPADKENIQGMTGDDPLDYLPEGFMERTKDFSFLVPNWAPQVRILGHESVGGFLTHCGWNSTLESIVHGVPMIAWPLYSEQMMNASLLVKGAKVALRPNASEDGFVKKEEVARVVEELMNGEGCRAVRRRVHELREAGAASEAALAEVVTRWKDAIVYH